MTQNKRNERKKAKDFPRGWTVCAYPCLHPVPSHQHCVWRQFRGTEKTYRDHVVKSIQFSNIYLLLQVEHMWLSGLNSYASRVYPLLSAVLVMNWGKVLAFSWEMASFSPNWWWVDESWEACQASGRQMQLFHSDLVKCLVTSKVR